MFFNRRSGEESTVLDPSTGTYKSVPSGTTQTIVAPGQTTGTLLGGLTGMLGNVVDPVLSQLFNSLKSVVPDIADIWDTISGNKIEYERTKELEVLARLWNSEPAQVARMLAAGLNPYMNGVSDSTMSAPSAPSAAGAPFNPMDLISGLFQAFKDIPASVLGFKQNSEDIKSARLENLEKANNLGLNKSKIEAELNHLMEQDSIARERWEQDKVSFQHEKDTVWNMQRERHEREMRSMDDSHIRFNDEHEASLYARTRRSYKEVVDDLIADSYRLANNNAEFRNNVMNNLEKYHLIAQTNSIINSDAISLKELGLKELDTQQRLRIGEFQERLLDGKMTEQEYANKLHEYGLTFASDPESQRLALQGKPAWRQRFNTTQSGFMNAVFPKLNSILSASIGSSTPTSVLPDYSGYTSSYSY